MSKARQCWSAAGGTSNPAATKTLTPTLSRKREREKSLVPSPRERGEG